MRKKKTTALSLKTVAVSDLDRAFIRAAVVGDIYAVALVERVFERLDELEKYVGDLGPPMKITMG